jgi:hypothetical protein
MVGENISDTLTKETIGFSKTPSIKMLCQFRPNPFKFDVHENDFRLECFGETDFTKPVSIIPTTLWPKSESVDSRFSATMVSSSTTKIRDDIFG